MLTSSCSPPSVADSPKPATVPARRTRRHGRRLATIGLASAVGLLALAGTASAHVTTNPKTAAQGGYATIDFTMPSEEDDASTVSLQVSFPTDHPVASVSVQPVPGWTVKVDTTKLATPITTDDGPVTEAVSAVTWTGKLDPGQFQQFPVSMGPLPTDTDALVFKAVQTYSNGDVVRWIDPTTPGGPEPEHPAPTLTLTAAEAGDAMAASSPAAAPPTAADAAAPAPPAGGGSSGPALTLGIIGAVLGLVGAVLGGLGLRRSRSGG